MATLTESIQGMMTPQVFGSLAARTGIPETKVRSGMSAATASIFDGIAGKARDPHAMSEIVRLVDATPETDDPVRALDEDAPSQQSGNRLLSLASNDVPGLIKKLGSSLGLGAGTARSLLGAAAGLVVGGLRKFSRSRGGIDATALSTSLLEEGPSLRTMPPGGADIRAVRTPAATGPVAVPTPGPDDRIRREERIERADVRERDASEAVRLQRPAKKHSPLLWLLALVPIALIGFWFANRSSRHHTDVPAVSNLVREPDKARDRNADMTPPAPSATTSSEEPAATEPESAVAQRDTTPPPSSESTMGTESGSAPPPAANPPPEEPSTGPVTTPEPSTGSAATPGEPSSGAMVPGGSAMEPESTGSAIGSAITPEPITPEGGSAVAPEGSAAPTPETNPPPSDTGSAVTPEGGSAMEGSAFESGSADEGSAAPAPQTNPPPSDMGSAVTPESGSAMESGSAFESGSADEGSAAPAPQTNPPPSDMGSAVTPESGSAIEGGSAFESGSADEGGSAPAPQTNPPPSDMGSAVTPESGSAIEGGSAYESGSAIEGGSAPAPQTNPPPQPGAPSTTEPSKPGTTGQLDFPANSPEAMLLEKVQPAAGEAMGQKPGESQWVVLDALTFPSGSADMSPEASEQLGHVAEILEAHPDVRIELGGYTDATGSPKINKMLSAKRAAAARQALIEKGVDGSRIVAKGFGSQSPIEDTKGDAEANRRVAVRILTQ